MSEILMPRLSEAMTSGTLLRWLVAVGQSVAAGDLVAEVETDKANMEIEALEAGIIAEIIATPGEDIPVGGVLARLAPLPAGQQTPSAPAPAVRNPIDESIASPLAVRLAQELGVNLDDITGSGPGGRILRSDIEEWAQSARTNLSGSTPPYRYPQGFVLRARVATVALVQSLSHLENQTRPRNASWSTDLTVITAIACAAGAALGTAAKETQMPLERPVESVGLTVVGASGLSYYELPWDGDHSLPALGSRLRPKARPTVREPNSIDVTLTLWTGIESIEPLSPGDIHLSIAFPKPLGDPHGECHISVTTEGDSKLPLAVSFMNALSHLLQHPLTLLSVA